MDQNLLNYGIKMELIMYFHICWIRMLHLLEKLQFIIYKSDASTNIKKLDNVYITKSGYALEGTMIGCNLLDRPSVAKNDFVYMSYQIQGIVYAVYGPLKSSSINFTVYGTSANMLYI